jgi:hypothetical protein
MNTKLLFASVTLASTAGLAGLASSAHAGNLEVGGQLQLLPVGEYTTDVTGEDTDFDTNAAFGIAGHIGYAITPNFSVGFAPRFILGIKPEDVDDADSATQLDLAVRLTGKFPVAPKVELFGYLAPGYSLVFFEDLPDDVSQPGGLVIGGAAGAAFKVTPTLAITGELGYTKGFQGTSLDAGDETVDISTSTSFLHLGVGVQTSF